MVDLVNTYVPALVELSSTELADSRLRVERYMREAFPNLDLSPNTVLGDLLVSPQAHMVAALEKGLDRFASDLNLGNVADNIIYNCDFVEQYLKNFAVDTSTYQYSSGVVRLVFSVDQEYVLDRSVMLSFNNEIFSIYTPSPGAFTIYKVGTFVPDGTNGTVLKDTGSGFYFADVPLLGRTGEANVARGTAGRISVKIPELGAITALVDFYSGAENISLPKQALRTRSTIHAASLNTRNGAVQYIRSACPFVDSIYTVHGTDRELLRDKRNTFGTATGSMDIYARTKTYAFKETQQVKLYLEEIPEELIEFIEAEIPDGATGFMFVGDFPYVGQPYYIESVTHPTINSANLEHVFVSSNTESLGAQAAYTQHEKLTLRVKNIVNEFGDSLFNVLLDKAGKKYVYVTVTYHTDPLFPALNSTITNPDYVPVNTSLMMRGFIPVVIEKFEVCYIRKPGVVPLLEEAAEKIAIYLDRLGAPDVYSDAVVAQIMQEAGVKYVREVKVQAYVQWTIGHTVLNYEGQLTLTPKTPMLMSSDALRVTYPSPEVDITASTMFSCSPRTIRYYLKENALSFSEIREM